MKKWVIFTALLIVVAGFAQEIIELKRLKPTEEFENIHVQKINDDEHQSSFVIWIKESVRLHKHEQHTENIYVISGKGIMRIGNKSLEVKKGDYFRIPKNTPHSLIVTSSKPMKVLSTQCPRFLGKDRVFIDE